jgi:hypothetical protein
MRPTRALLVPLTALALLLSACGETDDTSASDDRAKSGRETAAPDKQTEDANDPEDAEGSEGAECLVGEWEPDLDSQAEQTVLMLSTAGMEAQVDISGEALTTLTADTITSSYNNQTSDITWTMEGMEYRAVTVLNGSASGPYTATDTDITIGTVDPSGLSLSTTVYLDGVEMEVPGMEDMLGTQGAISVGTSTYTCVGDTFEMAVTGTGVGDYSNTMHRR